MLDHWFLSTIGVEPDKEISEHSLSSQEGTPNLEGFGSTLESTPAWSLLGLQRRPSRRPEAGVAFEHSSVDSSVDSSLVAEAAARRGRAAWRCRAA